MPVENEHERRIRLAQEKLDALSEERINRVVAASESMARDMADIRSLLLHLGKESERHEECINDLYEKNNATREDLIGFKGRVAAYGTVGGIMSGGIVAWLSRALGGSQ